MRSKNRFLFSDRTVISQNVKEAFSSVFPIALVILVLLGTLTPIDSGTFLAFLLGVFLVVFGMGVFTLGANTAMVQIGRYVSSSVVKTKICSSISSSILCYQKSGVLSIPTVFYKTFFISPNVVIAANKSMSAGVSLSYLLNHTAFIPETFAPEISAERESPISTISSFFIGAVRHGYPDRRRVGYSKIPVGKVRFVHGE